MVTHDCILLVEVVPKQYPDSYRYIEQGRPGNPTSIYKNNFETHKSFRMPPGSARRLEQEDWHVCEELRTMARERGIQGIFQVRHWQGGMGKGGKKFRKSTEGYGSRVLLREFEV